MTHQPGNEQTASTVPTIGQCLDELTRQQANTKGFLKDVKLSAEPRPLNHPPLSRSITAIRSDLREKIRAVVNGEEPWPIFMHGSVGTGKSCAALCILDRCIFSRRYASVVEFCERARQADVGGVDSYGTPLTLAGFWSDWRNADITCLDEIGSRSSRDRVSDHHYETVKRAIDERREEPAILVSNLPLADIAKVYDDRIASRLASGTVIEFSGPDKRIA